MGKKKNKYDLKGSLNELGIKTIDKIPHIAECSKIPKHFQITEYDFKNYPLSEIERIINPNKKIIESCYIYGQNPEGTELYVFDRLFKKEENDFYIPLSRIGREFKTGLHTIDMENIGFLKLHCKY